MKETACYSIDKEVIAAIVDYETSMKKTIEKDLRDKLNLKSSIVNCILRDAMRERGFLKVPETVS